MLSTLRWAMLGGCVGLCGCGSYSAVEITIKPIATRRTAPDFTSKDVGGIAFRLADYTGKVILLNFWTTTCLECERQHSLLNEVEHSFKDRGLTVIGLALDPEAETTLQPYVSRHKLRFQVVRGDAHIREQFGNPGPLPVTLLIDRKRRIAAAVRFLDPDNPSFKIVLHWSASFVLGK